MYDDTDLPFLEPIKPWKENDDDNNEEDSVERSDDEYTSNTEDQQEPQDNQDFYGVGQGQVI